MRKSIIVTFILLAFLFAGCGSKKQSVFSLKGDVQTASLKESASSNLPSARIEDYSKIENAKHIKFPSYSSRLVEGWVVPVQVSGKGVKVPDVSYSNVINATLPEVRSILHMQIPGNAKETRKGINEFFYTVSNATQYNWIIVFTPRKNEGKEYFDAYVFKISPLVWNRVVNSELKEFLQKHLILGGGKQ